MSLASGMARIPAATSTGGPAMTDATVSHLETVGRELGIGNPYAAEGISGFAFVGAEGERRQMAEGWLSKLGGIGAAAGLRSLAQKVAEFRARETAVEVHNESVEVAVSMRKSALSSIAKALTAAGHAHEATTVNGNPVLITWTGNLKKVLANVERAFGGAHLPGGEGATMVRTYGFESLSRRGAAAAVSLLPGGRSVALWRFPDGKPGQAVTYNKDGAPVALYDFSQGRALPVHPNVPTRDAMLTRFAARVLGDEKFTSDIRNQVRWPQDTHFAKVAEDGTLMVFNAKGRLDNVEGQPAVVKPNGTRLFFEGGAQVTGQRAVEQDLALAGGPRR